MRNTVCTLALTGLLAFGTAGIALAQSDTTPNTTAPSQGRVAHGHQLDPNRDLAHLTKKLDLTQDQQSQIQPILTDRDQQLNQLWQDTSMSRADKRAKSQQIRDDSDSKIRAVLNDDQKQKYSNMQVSRHHKRQVESTPGGQDTQPQ